MHRLACLFVLSLFAVGPAAFGQVAISVDAPITVQLGDGLKYLITLTNSGTSSANNLVLTDTLPAGTSMVGYRPVLLHCAGSNTIACDIGTLDAGQSVTVAIEIAPQAAGPLINAAAMTGGASVNSTTTVITNGVPLSVEVSSSNPADVVISSPAGINCIGFLANRHRCTAFFSPGSSVTLSSAGPDTFAGWSVKGSGTCPGIGTCALTMSQEQLVDAHFTSPVGFADSPLAESAVVNFPTAVDLSKEVVGGTPPYSFSVISGSLPPGLSLDGNTGKVFGLPTATGTFSATVQVTDSTSPTPGIATVAHTIAIINPLNDGTPKFTGPYALLFRGVNDLDSSERALVGTLTFDGLGGVSGLIDSNGNGSSPGLQTQVPVNGSYSVGPDGRGLIYLNNGSMIFATVAGTLGTAPWFLTARIISFDDLTGTGTRGAGELRRQDSTAFAASSVAGSHVLGLTGEEVTFDRAVEAGFFTADNVGNVTGGTADLNNAVSLFSFPALSGTYTPVTAEGRTILSLTYMDSNGAQSASSIDAFIVDADTLFLMSLDPGATKPVLAGTAVRQVSPGSFTNSSLAGPDVINLQGPTGGTFSTNSFVFLGLAAFANSTASVTYDSDENQIVQIQNATSGPYAVAANGRVQLAFPRPFIAYLAGQDQGYVMAASTGHSPDPAFGEINLQQGGPFSTESFIDTLYFFGELEPASPSGGSVASGETRIAACRLNFDADQSHAGGRLDYAGAGNVDFAVSPAGRMATAFADAETLGIGNLVGYFVSPSRAFVADVDPSSRHPHIVEIVGRINSAPLVTSLRSIAVTPASANVALGQTLQYTAVLTGGDGSATDITDGVDWVSSNLDAVTIDPSGLATGVGPGAANIVANLGCLSSVASYPVTLTVTPAAPVSTAVSLVTSSGASAGTSVYGQQVTFTASVNSVLGTGTPTGNATFYDGAISLGVVPLTGGKAPLTISSLAAGTHSISVAYSGDSAFAPSTSPVDSQVVNPAPLSITANNATKILDAPNPALTATYSGFVNNEGPGNLTGSLSCASTATTFSPVGSYPVTCSGQSSTNYSINYVAGTLKILYASGGLCDGATGHQILPPINADGSSVYNQGRTVPAKFRVCNANGVSIGPPPNVVSSFLLTGIITGTLTTFVQNIVDTNVPDAAFRWDSTDQQWIFNITTTNLPVGSTYIYTITLNDGSTIVFQFGLR